MLRAKIDLRQPIFLLKFTEDRDRFKVQETPGSKALSKFHRKPLGTGYFLNSPIIHV
jgi:hypothetical protein